MLQKSKIVLFTFLVVLAIVMDVYATITKNTTLSYYVGVLPMFVVSLFYLAAAKKKNSLFILFQFLCVIGDVLFVFAKEYLIIRTVVYIIAYPILTYLIYRDIKKISLKKLGLYIVFTFLLYLIIYFFIVNSNVERGYIPVFIYGALISFLIALTLYNYLAKMSQANFLIFLGMFSLVISDSIYSTLLFKEEHVITLSIVFVTYGIAQYLLCRGFILKSLVNN